MNFKKLSILFLLEKAKMNKKGLCPIKCRLTYNGKRKPFATGYFVKPKDWKNKLQKVNPPSKENDLINSNLSLISQKINEAFLFVKYCPE